MPEEDDGGLRGLHRSSTLVLSAAMAVIGIALVVITLVNGGGLLARGFLFGVLFALAGAGRCWFTWRNT
jgi:hypothetical protein